MLPRSLHGCRVFGGTTRHRRPKYRIVRYVHFSFFVFVNVKSTVEHVRTYAPEKSLQRNLSRIPAHGSRSDPGWSGVIGAASNCGLKRTSRPCQRTPGVRTGTNVPSEANAGRWSMQGLTASPVDYVRRWRSQYHHRSMGIVLLCCSTYSAGAGGTHVLAWPLKTEAARETYHR